MFDNIGKKIKGLAKFLCWVGVIVSLAAAIGMFVRASNARYDGTVYIIIGVVCLIVGPILSWIGSFITYGFGELVDKVASIERISLVGTIKPNSTQIMSSERLEKLDNLLSKGLITQKEYQTAVTKSQNGEQ